MKGWTQLKSGYWVQKKPKPVGKGPMALPLDPCESLDAYVTSIGGQKKFGKKVGYSRKAINEFINEKAPIPKSINVIWTMALEMEKLRTENARLKRRLKI